ncbi:hypothetical protein Hanom_Chr15g01351691 [Helianthus anomalus]
MPPPFHRPPPPLHCCHPSSPRPHRRHLLFFLQYTPLCNNSYRFGTHLNIISVSISDPDELTQLEQLGFDLRKSKSSLPPSEPMPEVVVRRTILRFTFFRSKWFVSYMILIYFFNYEYTLFLVV